MSEAIDTGLHWVDAPCPKCGEVEQLAIVISTVLTTPQDDVPTLAVKGKGSKLDHVCGQMTLASVSQISIEDGDS